MANTQKSLTRRYPPFILVGLAIFLTATLLPTVLNVPQSNPSQTLEYAPVTQGEDQSTNPRANLGSLGLGGTGTLKQGLSDESLNNILPGRGTRPSTKRCVGSPPRQTVDPLAPPCVAFFEGNNFGNTYQGVTRDEIKVLFYVGYYCDSSADDEGGERCRNRLDKYIDLAEPPGENEEGEGQIFALRVYQKYFNDHFQTYGRFVHFYAYMPSTAYGDIYYDTTKETSEQRRADAAENFAKIKPFAAVALVNNSQPYVDVMAQKNVPVFGSGSIGHPVSYFRKHPGMIWSYDPSLEYRVGAFTEFVCKKVVPYNVSFGGNELDHGSPRRLGLIYADEAVWPEIKHMGLIAKRDIEKCGGKFVDVQTVPDHNAQPFPGSNDSGPAARVIASMRSNAVTTIILVGYDANLSYAAAAVSYRPEWIVLGDGSNDANLLGKLQERSVWQHAWVVTPVTYVNRNEDEPCWQAYKEVDPDSQFSTPFWVVSWACEFYPHILQKFTGFQVAGPRLTPQRIEEGFRAIPPRPSDSPKVPACYYEAGDYTCVKDAIAEWWDPAGPDPINDILGPYGCWRLTEGGKRHIPGTWGGGDVLGLKSPATDVCNGWEAFYN